MYDLISANKRRSVFLLMGFVLLVITAGVAAGQFLGNPVVGTSIALIFSALMAGTSYWKSDSIALRVSRAKLADEQVYKRLHNWFRRLP